MDTTNVVFHFLTDFICGHGSSVGAKKTGQLIGFFKGERSLAPFVEVSRWGLVVYSIHHGLPLSIRTTQSSRETVVHSTLHLAMLWRELLCGVGRDRRMQIRRVERGLGRPRKELEVMFVKTDRRNGRVSTLPITRAGLTRSEVFYFFDRYSNDVLSLRSPCTFQISLNGYKSPISYEWEMEYLGEYFKEVLRIDV